MPNCSHKSVTVKRSVCASRTNRVISSIGVTFFHGIVAVCVTHHSGLSVTYLAGSNLWGLVHEADDGFVPYFDHGFRGDNVAADFAWIGLPRIAEIYRTAQSLMPP